MININDKTALEGVFAENFGSHYYPILANLYLQEGDLRRAKKVCEVGLKHDSSNVDGKFILAKVALAENKLTVAEKWLKQVVDENPAHFNALRLLIKIEIQLTRSLNTIQIYISRLLQFLPYDKECIQWLNEINKLETSNSQSITSPDPESLPENNLPNATSKITNEDLVKNNYEIVESMATFTMVQVLKSQKYYHQALAVLDVLKSNGRDSDRIAKEKNDIQQLLKYSIK
jgi:tetratricopeptide (TPR) repeat protein